MTPAGRADPLLHVLRRWNWCTLTARSERRSFLSAPRTATALQRIEVVIGCENCDRSFSYAHDLLGAARSLYGISSRAEADRRLDDQVQRLRSGVFADLPPHPCPYCGAVQSWMAPAARRQAADRWGCGTALAAAALGFLGLAAAGRLTFDLPLLAAVLLAALVLGSVADRWARRRWRAPLPLPARDGARPPEIRFL
ncbi:MAG TPA: hypothetical protein VGA32_01040 [Anaerolineales bacterium]